MLRTLNSSIVSLLFLFSSAEAAMITIPVGPGEGPAGFGGSVTLTELAGADAGKLQVHIVVDSGEIRGFFFDLASAVTGLSGSSLITTIETCTGPVDSCPASPKGNVMNPYGPFDWGLSIGGPGNDAGFQESITFVLSAGAALSVDLFDGQQVGVRVQQIPIPGTDREDSAKLVGVGGVPPQEIPEPASMMMLAGGIGLLALFRLRK
jgi:hypothetical protein